MNQNLIYLITFVLLISFSYAISDNDVNLKIWYPMNDSSGDLSDFSGNGFNAIANGTSCTYQNKSLSNWSTYSIYFDGHCYFNATNITRELNTSRDAFTILWLVELNTTGENNMWGSVNQSGLRGIRKYDRTAQNKNYFESKDDISGQNIDLTITDANKIFNEGRHWCGGVMVNSTGGSIWRNGTELGYDEGLVDPIDVPHFFIGFEKPAGERFIGFMSQFAIFNRSFTSDEIKAYCTEGIQPAPVRPYTHTVNLWSDELTTDYELGDCVDFRLYPFGGNNYTPQFCENEIKNDNPIYINTSLELNGSNLTTDNCMCAINYSSVITNETDNRSILRAGNNESYISGVNVNETILRNNTDFSAINFNATNATIGTLNVSNKVGIGKTPTVPLDIVLSATDDFGMDFDGTTNPYTGTTGDVAIVDFSREIGGSDTDNDYFRLKGQKFKFDNKRIHTGSGFGAAYNNWGLHFDMDVSGSHTINSPVSNVEDNIFGMEFDINRYGTVSGDSYDMENHGLKFAMIENTILNEAGETLDVTNYGSRVTLSGTAGTTTTGTKDATNYVQYLDAGYTDGSGTTSLYWLYLWGVGGTDTEWAIYDGTGANWALDADNQKIILGEGQDMEIYFDGTMGVINISEGNGTLALRNSSGGYGIGIAHDWATASPSIIDKGNRLDALPLNPLDNEGKLILDNDMEGITWKTIPEKDPDNCWEVIDVIEWCYNNTYNETQCRKKEPSEEAKEYRDYWNETYYYTECATKPLNVTLTGGIALENRDILADLKQENQMLKEELCLKDKTYSWC